MGSSLVVANEKAHYLKNVLRIKANHTLHFFIPNGSEYQAKVKTINRHDIVLSEIQIIEQNIQPSKLTTTLIQGISASDRMDYTVQKAAELGCTSLIPVTSDFCSQKIPNNKYQKKHQHWQAVAISASEQSGRTDIMKIDDIKPLKSVIQSHNQAIYLDPGAELRISEIPDYMRLKQNIIIGPEGGFSPTEVELFKKNNFLGVQLGQRVLRTETVAPVILSALHTLFGDFQS